RDRLHRLYRTKNVCFLKGCSHFRQFYKNNFTQFVLGIIRNTNNGLLAFNLDPLVIFGKQQLFRSIHTIYFRELKNTLREPKPVPGKNHPLPAQGYVPSSTDDCWPV